MSNIVKAEEKFLSISKVIDSEISTVLASNVNGFQKAFVMSSAIDIIKEQTGKIAAKAPEIEPVEDEDEDIVAENFEYERRQLQYRAGIIR